MDLQCMIGKLVFLEVSAVPHMILSHTVQGLKIV